MLKLPVLGCEELKKCLQKLGFSIDENRGKGAHALAVHPTKKPAGGQAPYITIRGLKEYGDPGFRSRIVNEIRQLKFPPHFCFSVSLPVEKSFDNRRVEEIT